MKTIKILELRSIAGLLIESKNGIIPPYYMGIIDALYYSGRITEASFIRIDRLLASIIRKKIISLRAGA